MPKKSAKSYQELKDELDNVMLALQRDDIGVDQALELYEHGLALLNSLEKHLKTAENKVHELQAKFKNT